MDYMQNLNQNIVFGGVIAFRCRPPWRKMQRTRTLQMGKAIIYMVLSVLAAIAAPGLVPAQDSKSTAPLALVEHPPSRYIVVKGDTLWDISERFLRDPWRWPDIWGLNRDEIKNPHWIYPGDVIILDFTGATPRLRFESDVGWTLVRQRVSPQMRTSSLDSSPVPTIPTALLRTFVSKSRLVTENELKFAPTIVSGLDGRFVLGPGDIAYSRGAREPVGTRQHVVRPGRTFTDPDTDEILGYEAVFLGETKVKDVADISTLKITRAVREINPGDKLLRPIEHDLDLPYMPRPPARKIRGKVIASGIETVSEIGPLQGVVLNLGIRNGLEIGNVLELSRLGEEVRPAGTLDAEERITLPDQRYGVVFVVRVYERLSYALVMNTTRPVKVNDFVLTPR